MKRIIDALGQGCYREHAAHLSGISKETFCSWPQRGTAARESGIEDECSALLDAVERADAEAEARLVDLWQSKMPNGWRAVEYLMARRYRDR